MANAIDVSTVTFDSGFTSEYVPIDNSLIPGCTLPDLNSISLPVLSTELSTLNAACKFQFPVIIPIPPTFIPKPQLPIIPCPAGYTFTSDLNFVGLGDASVDGSINIVQSEDTACGLTLLGGITVNVPPPICPDGMTISGAPLITFVNSEGSQSIDLSLSGGPCGFVFGGGGTIQLPDPVCPSGMTFNSNVVILGTGSASGSINITASGGPCDFNLSGGGTINVPPIPCPNGMSFTGSPVITVSGEAHTTDASGNAAPIEFALVGGPCNWKLIGGGNIVIPPPTPPPSGGSDFQADCLDCTATCAEIELKILASYSTLGATPVVGDLINLCNFQYEVVKNATSTCPTTINVVPFTVDSIDYLARKISDQCNDVFPFKILANGSTVGLYPGTVSQFWPSNISTTYSYTGTQYVVLTCETDGYSITSVTWGLSGSPPTPTAANLSTPPSPFYILVGSVTAGTPPSTGQTLMTSVNAVPYEWMRISNPTPDPFGLPYLSYYQWSVTAV